MISLTQLNYILNLLKHQNFQAAADASYVTQPTLSMQLKRAEDIIGFKIINRDTNPISLTDSGKKLLPLLLELKNSYDNLEIGIRKLEGTYKAEIRIGIIPTVSNYLVPEFYSKWKKEIHNVSLDIKEVTSEKLIQEVKNKTLDFGIMAGPLEDTSFQQQILFHEEIQIYTSEIEETTISLKQLKGLNPWLLGEDNCLRTQMIQFCQLDEGLEKDWKYEGGNLNVLVRMAEQEGGYTLVPQYASSVLNVNQDNLKRILHPMPFRQIIGFHLKRNSKSEHLNKIMQIIQQNKNLEQPILENSQILPWKA